MELPLPMPDVRPSFGDVELRAFTTDDVPMLLNLSTDPYVPLTGSLPGHTDVAGALAYIDRQHDRLRTGAGYSFCVAMRSTGEAVGQAGLWLASIAAGRATAGYSIAPRFRGHGLAGQALRAVTTFGWTLPDLHRIELYIEPWNVASAKTARAAGYEREGLLRSHQEVGGCRVDMEIHAVIRSRDPSPCAAPSGARPATR